MKIHYLLAEDERFASEEFQRMMRKIRPEYELDCWADSVEQTVLFLKKHTVDLLFLDIQLSDGVCFELFEQTKTDAPVIFTTAYDEYALRAFRENSVDYLLKPIQEERLEAALDKFERHAILRQDESRFTEISGAIWQACKKSRFLVAKGDVYGYVKTDQIAMFYIEDKCVFLHTFEGKRYIIDYTLDQLETMLDRDCFFRVTRNCVCQLKAIQTVHRFFNGRVRLELFPRCPHELILSRNRSRDFLKWLDGVR